MRIPRLARIAQRLNDPYGFSQAFAGLALQPEDLPGLTRECRQAGYGN